MPGRDYYEILGVDRGSDNQTIKGAYRTLAMRYHPDRNPGDAAAAEKMKEINEAYAVLSDAKKRDLYDTYGHAGLEGYTQEDIFRGVDFSSMFREFGLGDLFGFGGDLFGAAFGRSARQRSGMRRGSDLRYDLEITLEEVATGVEKSLEVSRSATCAGCRGTGAEPGGRTQCDLCSGSGQAVYEQRAGFGLIRQITTCAACGGTGSIIKEACRTCDGRGTLRENAEVLVRVPPGVESGHAIRITGEGEAGPDLPGDLYVVVDVMKHPVFQRNGDDIFIEQDVDMATAALGGSIEVPVLGGQTTFEVPEGAQTGTAFRIPGRGLPRLDREGHGDEYLVVKVITPTNLSNKEKKLLKDFRKLRSKAGGSKA